MERVLLWTVVEQKAKSAVDDCRFALEQARLKVEKLQGNQQRIHGLYGDYQSQRQQQESVAHQVASTAEIRHTQRQLLFLHSRVAQELAAGLQEVSNAQARLGQAEQHHLKMQKLLEQAQAAKRREEGLREQKELDQVAASRYRLLAQDGA